MIGNNRCWSLIDKEWKARGAAESSKSSTYSKKDSKI